MQQLSLAVNQVLAAYDAANTAPSVEEQVNLDFQPYSKTTDRPFIISDWANKNSRGRTTTTSVNGAFTFKNEDSNFNAVESRQPKTNKSFFRSGFSHPGASANARNFAHKKYNNTPNKNGTAGRRPTHNNRQPRRNNGRREEIVRSYSCVIGSNWEEVSRYNLTNPQGQQVSNIELLLRVGSIDTIDQTTSRATVAAKSSAVTVSTADLLLLNQCPLQQDPHINKIVKQELARQNGTNVKVVVLNEKLASLLMCAHHTYHSWDITAEVQKNVVYLSSTPNSAAERTFVDECNIDRLPPEADNINNIEHLSIEATAAIQTARHQMLARNVEPHVFSPDFPDTAAAPESFILHPKSPIPAVNPYSAQDIAQTTPTATAFAYSRLQLPDVVAIIRSPIHAHAPGDPETIIHIDGMLEFDSSINSHPDWRKNLGPLFASAFSHELKFNTAHVHRLVFEALFSHAKEIKLAWISRQNPKNATTHQLIHVSSHPIQNYISLCQIRKVDYFDALNTALFEFDLEPGSYTMLREPNERSITVYRHGTSQDEGVDQDTA